MAYEGKAQALVAMGKTNDPKKILEDALAKARSQQKPGHEADLLILLGTFAAQPLRDAWGFPARVILQRCFSD